MGNHNLKSKIVTIVGAMFSVNSISKYGVRMTPWGRNYYLFSTKFFPMGSGMYLVFFTLQY